MKNECIETMKRIEDSICYPLEPNERDELERHCAQCEACRTYREHLLRDDARLAEFALPHQESIRRVRKGAIERVRTAASAETRHHATEPVLRDGSRSKRALPRIPRIAAIAAAAASIVVAFLVIDFVRSIYYGTVPAFAAVQERMQKFESVTYRVRLWSLGQWRTREEGRTRSRLYRKNFGDSIVVTGRRGKGANRTELHLYPAEHRAVISQITYPYPPTEHDARWVPPDAVDLLASWYKAKGFSFVRKERLGGINTAVYERAPNPSRSQTQKVTAWVDLETELPIRFEIVAPRSGPNSDAYPYQLRLSDFQGEDSGAASWVDVKPGEPCAIVDDFKWYSVPDTSYFSLIPPAGYAVETRQEAWDTCMTEGEHGASRVRHALSLWLGISGGVFPDDLADLDDPAKVKPLLIAKYRRGGDPAEEFRAAYELAKQMQMCSFTTEVLVRRKLDVSYVGKGTASGDSKRVICWLKDENPPPCPARSDNGPYFSIYGDLHKAASPTPPRSAGQ